MLFLHISMKKNKMKCSFCCAFIIFAYMEKTGLISQLISETNGKCGLGKVEKVYLDNTNIKYSFVGDKSMNQPIKGILFDMDGVLVDSEAYIFEAARLMFAEHGVTVKPEDALPFVGTGENRYISGIGESNGFIVDIERDKARTYAIYEEITRSKLRALPGVHTFIKNCKDRGLKMAVASSADRIKIAINLREIGLSADIFDAVISGEDVERKKPFPDIYLLAAERIGIKPEDCLVVEDAVSGIAAGKAAGCKCLALTTSFPSEKLQQADWICKDLSEASI